MIELDRSMPGSPFCLAVYFISGRQTSNAKILKYAQGATVLDTNAVAGVAAVSWRDARKRLVGARP